MSDNGSCLKIILVKVWTMPECFVLDVFFCFFILFYVLQADILEMGCCSAEQYNGGGGGGVCVCDKNERGSVNKCLSTLNQNFL